jgi:hypothetical protein
MSSVSARGEFSASEKGGTSGSIPRRVAPIAFAALAALVPAITTLAIFWAQHRFYEQYSLLPGASPPTISREISEPTIANPFAISVSIVGVLLGLVCWRIVMLYRAAIDAAFRQDARKRALATLVILAATVSEACSILGMVALSWLTERTLHITGSYLFFFGQASAIIFTGIACRMLLGSPAYDEARGWSASGLSPRFSRWRSHGAPCIAVAALVFWIMFLVRDGIENPPLWLNQSFSILEILLIESFLRYLLTYVFELYRSNSAISPRPN